MKSKKTKSDCEINEKSLLKQQQQHKSKKRKIELSIDHIVEKELQKLKHNDPVLRLELSPPHPPSSSSSSTYSKNQKLDEVYLNSPLISLSNHEQQQQPGSLLSTLMYPLKPSSFLASCFRHKAVYISSNNPDRAADINTNYMFDLDVRKILSETSSENIFLWIKNQTNNHHSSNSDVNDNQYEKKHDNKHHQSSAKHKKNTFTSATTQTQPLKSIEIPDPETAFLLHTSSNYATYCRAPPELEQPLVYAMLRDTGLGLGNYDPTNEKSTTLGRGEVEVFIGTPNHITDWHFDFQENFTIQLSGSKKWTLKQGTIRHPLRGATPHYYSSPDVVESQLKASRLSNHKFQFGKQDMEGNAFGEEETVILKAGDVLYFPAGMWHKVETLEYGISINISLMGTTYASLVCKSLEHLLLKSDAWREVICSKGCTESHSKSVMDRLDTLLSELPNIIRDFQTKQGGAESIIPPVLRQPPIYSIAHNGDEAWTAMSDDSSELGDNNDDDEEEEEEEEAMSEQDKDEISIENENETVIKLSNFICPEGWSSKPCTSNNHHYNLVKNPLALLIRQNDLTRYYSNQEGQEDDDDDTNNDVYILNVSYAGNEMHESLSRVVLQDDTGENVLKMAMDNEENGVVPKEPHPALIYYGYYVWTRCGKEQSY